MYSEYEHLILVSHILSHVEVQAGLWWVPLNVITFLYNFRQTLNYLTPRKIRIAYFYGQRGIKKVLHGLCA